MQAKVEKAILQHGLIHRGETVLVGVSGGADSVALLTLLKRIAPKLGFGLAAAHLNHMIRGEGADRDERFTRELCELYGVPLAVERIDVPALAAGQGQTLETAGRAARYAFLERTAQCMGASRIAVAHHMDDQAESVLLHLARGSGLSGLCGMRYQRGSIIRPLLGLRRAEIEGFLNAEGIAYCVDATNFEPGGSRNRLRLDVVPYLGRHINPAIVPALCSAAELLSRDEDYLMQQAEAELARLNRGGGYLRQELAALPLPLQTRAIRAALRIAGAVSDIERVHVEQVMAFLSARTGARLSLPHVEAWVSYELIFFGQAAPAPEFEVELCTTGQTHTPLGSFSARMVQGNGFCKDKNVACMDLARLPQGLVVRTRRPGDRFFPLGAPGRRKLKDFFIDKKVPREQRILPLVCSGGEVLFVPGFGVSETVKVTPDTQRMLVLEYCDIKIYQKQVEGKDG